MKSVTLTPKQMGGSGLTIEGTNFTIYKVSYSASQATVDQPAGTLLFSGSQNMYDWGVNQLRIDKSRLTGITNGSKIHVAGLGYAEGRDSWQVQIAVGNPWHVIATKDFWHDNDYDLVFEVNEAQADSLASGDLVIQGINFVLNHVTIENPSAPNPGEPTITSPASYTWADTQVFNAGWQGDVQLLKSDYQTEFSGLGAGTVIHVYGYGNESTASTWTVKIQRKEQYNWMDLYNYQQRTVSGNNMLQSEHVTFELSEDEAKALKKSLGLVVYGQYFTAKYIYIDNTNATPIPEAPTPPTTGTSIWSVTEYPNQVVGSESFSGLTNDTPANLYISGSRGQWYWEAKIYRDNTSFLVEASDNNNDNSKKVNTSWGHWDDDALANTAEGYVALPLTGDDVNFIKQNGLQIWLGNITITKIELRQ